MIIVFLRTFHAYLHDRRQLSLPNDIGKSEFSEISRFLFRVFFISFFLAFVFLVYQLCLKLVFPLLTLPSVLFPSLSTLSSSTTPIFTVLESDIGRRLNEETSSLFGIISSLDPVVGTLSFIIIVAAVMFVDFAFYGLSLMSHDTPFEQLIPAIQKELMIAGCTAFVFKIIVNASNNSLSHTWFIALEYADLVVPIFSFVYCFIGLILISMSVRQCDLWSKAYHMKLLELLDEFFDYSETVRFQYFNWIPNNIVTELEFRIFHNIFCDAYKIQRKAFAFDEYVDKVFERFVMEVVEIRSWDWFIVSLLFTLNIIRMSASINFGKKCEEHDKSCKNSGLSEIFALGGLLLFVLTVIVAFYSRYLELKIMKSRGILNIDHYYNYLHHMEHQKERVEEHVRMDVSELKAAVEQVKNRGPKKKKGIHSFLAFFGGGGDDVLERLRVRWPEFMQNGPQIGGVIESFSTKLTNRKKKDAAAAAAAQKKGLTRQWSIFPSKVMRDFSISEDEVQESMKRYAARNNNSRGRSNQDSDDGSGALHSRSLSAPDTISRAVADHNDEKEDLENGRRGMHERANTTSMVTPDIVDKDFLSSSKTSMPDLSGKDVDFDNLDQKDSEGKTKTKGEQDIALNFPFGRPVLYFETVQIIILLTSLYLALWITNFDVAADSATWKILTLIPGVGSAIVYLLIVKTAALLKSVSELDNDAVLEVIEQTEGSRLLGITMREKILSRLRDLGEPQAELFTLFHEIDSSRNGSLSREEFAAFLNAIEINFSRKKWQQIFREIDLNYDDKITFEEFFLFLFPDHDVGLALEKRRMKLLGSRVKIKADRYEKESKKKRTSILHNMFHTHHALILPAAIDEEERRQDSGPSKVNHNVRKARTGSVISPRDQPRTNYAGNGAATSFRNSIVSPRDFTGRIATATAGILSPGSNKPGEAPYQP